MKTQLIPKYKFDEMVRKLSAFYISEKGVVKDSVFYENLEYVVIGAMGSGNATGWLEMQAHRVVDLENYRGEILPLPRVEHHRLCSEGKREIGYEGQLIPFGQRHLVFCEMVKFRIAGQSVQQELF